MAAGMATGEDGGDGRGCGRAAVRAALGRGLGTSRGKGVGAGAGAQTRVAAILGDSKGRSAKATARAEAKAWAAEQVLAGVRAGAEALVLAGVLEWARGEARAQGETVPPALADSSMITDTLFTLNRHGVARDLWPGSPETRDEYSSIIHFIAPITRLPLELLRDILLIIINEASSPPSALILVCKYWHTIVTGIWGSLNLGMRTPMRAVTRKLKRNQWLLDIVVDTDSDRGDFILADGAFEAVFAAIEASSRWRSLVVKSFPGQGDLPDDLVNHGLQRCPNAAMSRFTTLKIKSACEASPLLHGLLRIIGTTAASELTRVEINSANVISFLAPAYPSIFHSVKVLSLDIPGIPHPVDLLPHLHQLETFNASHISFPIYDSDVDLPLAQTLRHLRLKAVSIQWMSGRTFHVLEDLTLIFPLHHHVLHTFNTALPNCKHLTFQGSPLDILTGISAHKLAHLSVTCSGSFNRRGNQQLVWLSRHVLAERRLAPKILHIGIEATNQAWINALTLMLDLEELVINSAAPSSLGVRVVQSLILIAPPVRASKLGTTYTPREWRAPLCPSLKRFGLKYRRWLRRSEHFDLIPDIVSVIKSREHSNYPLQSFGIWMTGSQKDPLELIEDSRMSRKGLEHFADESGIEGLKLCWFPRGDWDRQEQDGSLAPQAQDDGPRAGGQAEVREFHGDPDTAAPMILHPSTQFPTLVERAKRFVRKLIPGKISR